ncbi:NAD-dependent epimerase/dehydratase family protein [Microbulbifer epialgicus]|uniref:NAD-dependent epimerase/dehydratase family protein n=1 Tax=Microbulbifer epialgicus TaxID=393907 RepID=A0ABV4P4D1_9GAMM
MNIGITGASGYVGQFIVRYFLQRGCQVRALLRSAKKAEIFYGPSENKNLKWIKGDLADDRALSNFVDGLNIVIHGAYDHLPGRYRGGEGSNLAGFLEANLNRTLVLMQKAHAARVEKFLFISSRAVYATGQLRGILREGQVARPDTFYGAYKSAVEAMVSAWAQQRRWHAVSLRLTGVYGVVNPLARSKWYDIARSVVRGESYLEGRTASEVHGEDVARAVALLLGEEDARGLAVNCSDRLVSNRQVAKIIQLISGERGPLPPEAQGVPPAVMDCAYLRRKGFCFGGEERLRESLRKLVEAVQEEQRLSR